MTSFPIQQGGAFVPKAPSLCVHVTPFQNDPSQLTLHQHHKNPEVLHRVLFPAMLLRKKRLLAVLSATVVLTQNCRYHYIGQGLCNALLHEGAVKVTLNTT